MQVRFNARHMELTDTIKSYTTSKVEKLKRYMDLISEATVTLSVEKYRHKVEITIKGKGGSVSGTEVSDDMYLSLDRVFDKIEKQLRRRKDRRINKFRSVKPELNQLDVPASESTGTVDASTIVREEIGDNIVETDVLESKPMSTEDAFMQFKSGEEDYIVYRDIDAIDQINVLYRRHDGLLGLIRTK